MEEFYQENVQQSSAKSAFSTNLNAVCYFAKLNHSHPCHSLDSIEVNLGILKGTGLVV